MKPEEFEELRDGLERTLGLDYGLAKKVAVFVRDCGLSEWDIALVKETAYDEGYEVGVAEGRDEADSEIEDEIDQTHLDGFNKGYSEGYNKGYAEGGGVNGYGG